MIHDQELNPGAQSDQNLKVRINNGPTASTCRQIPSKHHRRKEHMERYQEKKTRNGN